MRKKHKLALLLFQHGDTYMKCPGCEQCDKIKAVADSVEPKEVIHSKVFDKGAEMSLKEVKFLLDKGIGRDMLKEKLECSNEEFKGILTAIGMYKPPSKKAEVNKEDVIKLRQEGVMWKDIAKKYDVSQTYLMKLRKELNIPTVKYSKKDQLKENKIPSGRKRNEFTQETKRQIDELQGAHCYVCESPQVQYHHVKYRSRSGRGVKRNGLPLCNFHHNDSTYGIHHNRKFRNQIEEVFIDRFGEDYYKDEHDLFKEGKIAEPSKELLEQYFKEGGFE